jgi:serine-aspartate repeat-containing protein C/D/E
VNTGMSENELENVTVQLINSANVVVATTTTDAFGDYTFSNVVPGTYTVQFSNLPSGYVFTTQNAGSPNGSDVNSSGVTNPFTVAPGVDVESVDAGAYAAGATIGNYVWHDANANGLQDEGENGIAGTTVTLYDGAGTEITTTTTDGDGFYSFPVSAGIYAVGFYRAGWIDYSDYQYCKWF